MRELGQLYDYTLLHFLHHLAESTNGALTPFFRFISYFGDKGIFFIALPWYSFILKRQENLVYVSSLVLR